MPLPLFQIDAFTSRPFRGNPAAVCLLDRDRPDDWMQAVAEEMNLSETAFVRPLPDRGDHAFALRWFTPAAEVELCGHATLAAAHALYETGRVAPDRRIDFHTRYRGTLACAPHAGPLPGADEPPPSPPIAMAFPADPAEAADPPAGLLDVLGVRALRVARSRYDWIVELASPEAVRGATPDFAALARFDCRGIALTAANPSGSSGVDITSRFFAPRLRINEDPVTGSLHCVLGPYWSPRLGKATLRCRQASPRGGELVVTTRPDGVEIAGQAITVLRAELVA